MKQVVFQAPREPHPAFGTIWRPVIEITLRTGRYQIRTEALVDPGADITLLPKRLGDALHLTVHPKEPIREVRGVGEGAVPIVIRKVHLGLGPFRLSIRLGWVLIEEVPVLLGRLDLFDAFDITYKQTEGTLVFTKRPRVKVGNLEDRLDEADAALAQEVAEAHRQFRAGKSRILQSRESVPGTKLAKL